ncbi:MAG: ABC transporter permease [Pseudobdellovibrio sp.]
MIFLALQYLLQRKRQTLFTLLGVFFGTVAYVTVSGFFLGFQGFMVEQLVNNSAQIHIQAREDYLLEHDLDKSFYKDDFSHAFWISPPSRSVGYLEVQDPQSWYQRLAADPRVQSYAPTISAPVIFRIGKISVSANLIGCDPEKQQKVTSLASYMTEGKFSDIASGGNRIIVGEELRKRLGAGLNQTILVASAQGNPLPFKVVGHFYTGNRGLDLQAYGNLIDVQRLNNTPNRVSEIGVRLKDYTEAKAIATGWGKIAPELVESWDMQSQNVLSVFAIQTVLRFSMILTVLVVASFGIYNILNMTVNQKRQDIAILRSMGYDTFDIVMLFFFQGLIVGVIGAVIGLAVGYFICRYLQTIPFMNVTPSNPNGYLHIALSVGIYAQAMFMAIFSVSIASILPARSAGQLTPIDVIRSGG